MTAIRDAAIWGRQQFPDATIEGMNAKLEEEWGELKETTFSATDEMADVVIVLAQRAAANGDDLEDAVLRKLDINRRRQWGRASVDGAYRHTEEAA